MNSKQCIPRAGQSGQSIPEKQQNISDSVGFSKLGSIRFASPAGHKVML